MSLTSGRPRAAWLYFLPLCAYSTDLSSFVPKGFNFEDLSSSEIGSNQTSGSFWANSDLLLFLDCFVSSFMHFIGTDLLGRIFAAANSDYLSSFTFEGAVFRQYLRPRSRP